ncbi:MAG: hypothetical protein Q9186_006970 [Xanthomendoza sp. 1 TL-2023]
MAEVLFDDVDDDDLWIEDPYAEADDLAEHTMPSPVLINYDPTFDVDDGWTDWEEYSDAAADDIYDKETPKRKRRKLDDGMSRAAASKSMGGIPVLSLGELVASDGEAFVKARSIVQWKVRVKSPELPVLQVGEEEKVSILKDWKERFKPPPPKHEDSTSPPTNGTQRAFAVVIENDAEFTTARRDSKIYDDVDESDPYASTSPLHCGGASKVSSTHAINGSNTALIEDSPSTRKRKYSSSPDPVSEPVIAQNLTKHQSGQNASGPMRSSVAKRKASGARKQAEPQAKKTKAKKIDDAAAKKENLRPNHLGKRKIPSAPKQLPEPESEPKNVKKKAYSDSVTKKENIRPSDVKKRKLVDAPEGPEQQPLKKVKTKGSDDAAMKKENIRPKAVAVGRRRSTRRT